MGLPTNLLPGTSALDSLKLDTSTLKGLTNSIAALKNAANGALVEVVRQVPTSISKAAATSNTFKTDSLSPSILDMTMRNQMDEFMKSTNGTLQRMSEAANSTIKDGTSFLEAQTTMLGGLISSASASVGTVLSNVAEAATDAYDYVSDALGSIDLPDFDFSTGLFDDIKLPGVDLGEIKSNLSKIGLSVNFDDISNVVKMGYKTVTNLAGEVIDGIPATTDFSFMSSATTLLNKLCGLNLESLLDFSLNKNLFNLLLQQILGNGVSGLLSSMLKCATYVDNLSRKQVNDFMPTFSVNGDVKSMYAAVQGLGTGSISDIDRNLRVLTSHASNTPSNVRGITDMINTTSSFKSVFGTDTVLGAGYVQRYVSGSSTVGAVVGSKINQMANVLKF